MNEELPEMAPSENESLPPSIKPVLNNYICLDAAEEQAEEVKAYSYENGCVYEGQWLGGMRHGHGVFKWQSGSVYTGQWNRD